MMAAGRILRQVALLAWAAVCLFPLYWMAIGSFKSAGDVVGGAAYVPFVDFQPTLNAWRYILFESGDDTLKRFANSALVACASTLLTLLLGGLAGLAVVRWRGASSARERMMVALLATRILPPVVTVIPVYVMANAVGGIDSLWVLIAVYTATSLPVALWLLRDGFADVPGEVLDAAELDGASFLRLFFTMAVPLARPAIAATGLIVFILSWNEYTFALFLTTDHALTLPPFLAGQMAVREQMASAEPQWDYFSVLIVLMVAPLLAGTGVLQRFLSGAFLRRARE